MERYGHEEAKRGFFIDMTTLLLPLGPCGEPYSPFVGSEKATYDL
jgi:hypothetical protein